MSKQISLWYATTNFEVILSLLDLGVKGQSQMNVTIKHETSSNYYAPTYKISLTHHERQKSNGPHKLSQLFDPESKVKVKQIS